MAECEQGCQSAEQLVIRAARLLNDYADDGDQFVRWPKPVLLDYLNEALCQVSAHRRDAFAAQAVLQLKPGPQQTLDSAYLDIVSLGRNMTRAPDGSPVLGDQIVEQNQKFAAVFRKKPCLASQACSADAVYAAKSFARNPVDPAVFDVTPPVPVGSNAEVMATVIRKPPKLSMGDLNKCVGVKCEFEAALIDWMLYRALSTDMESEVSAKMSARHETSFYNLLGVQKRNRAEFNTDVRHGLPVPSSPTVRYRPRMDPQ